MQSLLPSFLKTSFSKPGFLKSKPLIDQTSADFIFASVAWVLQNFDHEEFFKRTQLVAPSNEFFPGRVSSVDEKAQNIFAHTVRYAGLRHWPFELRSMLERKVNSECQVQPTPQPELAIIQRNSFPQVATPIEESIKATGVYGKQVPVINTAQPLFVFYDPQQTLKPEDLSASYAHIIAQHLIIQSGQQPPGGPQFFAEASEVLASMMGFGVLLTNSAYTFRGGCGSCYNAMANRQPALTELDSVFALALFCQIKGINNKNATQHLKKHLRASYKQAVKQIEQRLEQLNELKKIA
ncbi:MAG: hypothetical protein V7785_06165 [Bermanella sp.]